MSNEGKIIALKKVCGINPQKENLTIEKLRAFSGFENINDQQAEDTVFAIQTLAGVIYEFMGEQKLNENQKLKTAA